MKSEWVWTGKRSTLTAALVLLCRAGGGDGDRDDEEDTQGYSEE